MRCTDIQGVDEGDVCSALSDNLDFAKVSAAIDKGAGGHVLLCAGGRIKPILQDSVYPAWAEWTAKERASYDIVWVERKECDKNDKKLIYLDAGAISSSWASESGYTDSISRLLGQ